MANINVRIDGPLMDGHRVTFKAPCACSQIERLKVKYLLNNEMKSATFQLKDSHGASVVGLGNLFEEGAYVTVILDTTNKFAYLQNADTNSYLEQQFYRRPRRAYEFLPDVGNAYESLDVNGLKFNGKWIYPENFSANVFRIGIFVNGEFDTYNEYVVYIGPYESTDQNVVKRIYGDGGIVISSTQSGYLYVKVPGETRKALRVSIMEMS